MSPYVPEYSRVMARVQPHHPGELNYALTYVINEYLRTHGESYRTYNDLLGALEGAKLELYRRKIAWYEDIKLAQEGDVYD